MNIPNTAKHTGRAYTMGVGLMASMAKYGCVFAPEDDNSGGNDDAAAEAARVAAELATKKENEGGATARARRKAEAAETEAADLREKLKAFDGIDPTAFKALMAEKADRDAAKAKTEEDKLKASGDFDRLRASMAEQHKKDKDALALELATANEKLSATEKRIAANRVENAFAGSRFITENTILTPSKAQRVYDDHFEVEDGALVGFDRPRGSSVRTKLVDAAGDPVAFDEAIKRIIEGDPDKDVLLRSKIKNGPGAVDHGGKGKKDEPVVGTGISRISAALAKMKLS